MAEEVDSGAPYCGIVMPISETDGCDETHWKEVLAILAEAISSAGMVSNLVSDAADIGVIQQRIVQNLYQNPIVVCDISGRNANVMFELGMRLAFDKPVIIVKDDKTPYSFDTSPIEHLSYPRDLRFSAIVAFKEKLRSKIEAAKGSKGDRSFLKSFGDFQVVDLNIKSVPADELILKRLSALGDEVAKLRRAIPHLTEGIVSVRPRIRPFSELTSSAGWTDQRIDRLVELWADGKSASEIARDLGGVTRNAVVGKIHRMGLHVSRSATLSDDGDDTDE